MTEALYAPTPPTRRATIKNWQDTWRRRWTDASQTTRTWIQVGVLLGAVLIAYNYSLSTLLQTVDQQTPLAYISLVPAIALALAAVRARPLKPEPPIYDRQVDYTIGIPLILAAMAINELLPARMSALFWFYRVDLFSLPIFVAGAVAIIFGCRVLWRQKLAIAFLFLAWPYPYEKYLTGSTQRVHRSHPGRHGEDRRVDPPRHARRPHRTTRCSPSITTARPLRSASCLRVPGSTAWSASCWSDRPLPRSSVVPLCAGFSGSPAAWFSSGPSTSAVSPSSFSPERSGESPSPLTSSIRSSVSSCSP